MYYTKYKRPNIFVYLSNLIQIVSLINSSFAFLLCVFSHIYLYKEYKTDAV